MGGHVARMMEGRGADRVLVRKYEEKDRLEDLGIKWKTWA